MVESQEFALTTAISVETYLKIGDYDEVTVTKSMLLIKIYDSLHNVSESAAAINL